MPGIRSGGGIVPSQDERLELSIRGGSTDFIAYWAAARLLLTGDNPYSPSRLFELQRETGGDLASPMILWNPPWVLSFTLPFGAFDFATARFLWLLCHIFLLLFAARQLWRIYGNRPTAYRAPWLLALTFGPSLFVLILGQITPLVLVGLTAFLYFEQKQRWTEAGAALVLCSLKPHFLYLFWIALGLWIWQRRPWRLLLGAMVAGSATTIIPVVLDPGIFFQYVELYRTLEFPSPLQLPAPSLRNALMRWFTGDSVALQFLPTAAGAIWILYYWRRHKDFWRWTERLPLILLASLSTSAYVWTFDQVVLLPAVIQGAAWLRRRSLPWYTASAAMIFIGINALYLTLKVFVINDFWYFWMAPALLVTYLILRRETSPVSALRPAG